MEIISDRDFSSLARFTLSLETHEGPCQILENAKNKKNFPTGVGVKFSTISSVSSMSTTVT